MMIKEEVIFACRTREEAITLANDMEVKEGYEPIVQRVHLGVSSFTPVAFIVIEREME
jgi:hypothetical protein